ncbi:MAG: RNA polymerase sigma factor [Opitutales bacterium]|nr:RNA polymerase sigma factor [Opitutales bacterium]
MLKIAKKTLELEEKKQSTLTKDLLEQIYCGQKEKYGDLFKMYQPRLSLLLHYKLSSHRRIGLEIEDVLQELFVKAFSELHTFEYRGKGSFFSWLVTYCDHIVLDKIRYHSRKKRDFRKNTRIRTGGVVKADQYPSPSEIAVQNERWGLLSRALDQLSENDRELILLAKIKGVSTKEIAAQKEKPVELIYVSLHRALQKLKSMIDTIETL